MAKTVNLEVKVNDDQFKSFQKNFNDLADKIKGLSGQFRTAQQSIDKTAANTKTLSDNMKSLLDMSRQAHGSIEKITTHFGKWATLISGVVMMIGAGTGLMGIDRLTRQVMDRRRQMLAVGGPQADVGAAQRAGAVTGTGQTLQNIAEAMADPQKATALFTLGGYRIGAKQTPEDIYRNILKTLPEELAKHPDTELTWARGIGLTQQMSEQEILSYRGQEGKRARDLQLWAMDQKATPMSPQAQDELGRLRIVYGKFTENLQNRMGELLGKIAPGLSKLSEGLMDAIKTIMKWPVIEQITTSLKRWLENFGQWLEKDETQKNLKQFGDEVGNVLQFFKDLGKQLDDFNSSLKQFADWVRSILGLKPSSGETPSGTPMDKAKEATESWADKARKFLGIPKLTEPGSGPLGLPNLTPEGQNLYQKGKELLQRGTNAVFPATKALTGPSTPQAPVSSEAPTEQGRTTTFQNAITNSRTMGPLYNVPTPAGPGSPTGAAGIPPAPGLGGRTSLNFGGAVNQFASLGGALNRFAAVGIGGNTRIGGGTNLAFGGTSGGNTVINSSGGGGAGGGVTKMASAVSGRAPGQSNWALSVANRLAQNTTFNVPGGRGGRGPLDADNWQSSRTATLRLDNTAGSNPYVSAAGMSVG